jgi:hypothetical protein
VWARGPPIARKECGYDYVGPLLSAQTVGSTTSKAVFATPGSSSSGMSIVPSWNEIRDRGLAFFPLRSVEFGF